MKAYEAIIYRDEPDEANVDSRTLGWEPTQEAAVGLVKRGAAARGWPLWTGTVHEGHIETREAEGVTLEEFVDEEKVRWYVGPDWIDREDT